MKKLALSVVVFAVMGAGASLGAVGCSTSSSLGNGTDAGGLADVTAGDTGPGLEAGTEDTGPGGDTGTGGDAGAEGGCAAASCTVDASIAVVGTGPDGGQVENTSCEMCIGTSCAAQQCDCLSDPTTVPVDDAGGMAPACGAYAVCVYQTLLALVAASDAGASGEAAELTQAEAMCATGVAACSEATGKGLIGCIAGHCASQCVQ